MQIIEFTHNERIYKHFLNSYMANSRTFLETEIMST